MKKQTEKAQATRKQRNIKEKRYLAADRLDDLLLEEGRGAAAKLAAELNVEPQAISNYRRGIADPTMDNLIKIAEHYHVSVDWLLGRLPEENKSDNELVRAAANYTGLSSDSIETLHEWLQTDWKTSLDSILPDELSLIIENGVNLLRFIRDYRLQVYGANKYNYIVHMTERSEGMSNDLWGDLDKAVAAFRITPEVYLNSAKLLVMDSIDDYVKNAQEEKDSNNDDTEEK